jgi:hypothetical protein
MPPSAAPPPAGVPQLSPAASNVFQPQTAQGLLQIFRLMYPHDPLDDSCYEYVVQKCASRASTDRDFADLIENGVSKLNGENHWSQLSEADRLRTLHQIENGPFFQVIRTEFLLNFYGNPLVWRFLGYEGPSNELGGYINRGFDEIEWLNAG